MEVQRFALNRQHTPRVAQRSPGLREELGAEQSLGRPQRIRNVGQNYVVGVRFECAEGVPVLDAHTRIGLPGAKKPAGDVNDLGIELEHLDRFH